VLAPHHGAAPLGGPRFYNPKLNPRSGMLAVISVGKSNTYGHPRAAVLKQAMAARANIQLVTEDTAMGLHEVFVLTMR
jgi:beta-lactamase superfamily II metal-dependent hydrolase